MKTLHKYPRTHHIEGSRFQPGDEDLDCIPFSQIKGRRIVVEEKLDGANAAISFDEEGRLFLQSRGHFLDGGARERQFDLFKTWANCHRSVLLEMLGSRYVLYGEWLYAKHTIFYDALPHYFLEFDVLDTLAQEFLSTERRRAMLDQSPIKSVPVLWTGEAQSLRKLQSLVAVSLYKSSEWRERLDQACIAAEQDGERVRSETDLSDLAEGLYIKLEENCRVVERYKFIRASFLAAVRDSGSHWMDRPLLANRLREGVNIFGGGK